MRNRANGDNSPAFPHHNIEKPHGGHDLGHRVEIHLSHMQDRGQVISLGIYHLHSKGDDFAGSEVLTKIALEKAIHELLEGNAFGIEVSLVEAYGFHVRHEST